MILKSTGRPMALSTTTEKSATVKRALVFVLVPALVAGFFSILPKIYEVLVQDRTALSYELISGPPISLPDGFRRIFAIEIQNNGKVPLTHIEMQLHPKNGSIEAIAAGKSLLHTVIDQNASLITIERMLRDEHVNLSVMVKSTSSEPTIDLDARSNEAVAVARSKQENQTSSGVTLAATGAALSAVSVAFMSVVVLLRLRRGGLTAIMRGYKPDIITFIAGLSRVIPMTEGMLITEHEMSYARLGDAFLFIGANGDEATRRRCVAGLRALLMLREVSDTSIQKIRQNLSFLNEAFSDDQFSELRREAAGIGEAQTRQKIVAEFENCSRPKHPETV